MFNWITNIGPIKFIFYSIYYVVSGIIGDFLPHLATIIITIIIIIILFVCPMIGFYSAFGSACSVLYSFIFSIFKLIIYTIISIFGKNNGQYLLEIIEYLINYDYNDLYEYFTNIVNEIYKKLN